MAASTRKEAQKYIALNRRARFDYLITDTMEVGMVLTGTEVKSLRQGQASLAESFAGDKDGQLCLINAHIAPYAAAGKHLQHDPRRPRALLLHKREHAKLMGSLQREGMTLVPLEMYFNARGRVKLRLGLAKGKRKEDKRATIKEREWNREKARTLRGEKS